MKFSAVILAGGNSSRMGRDKAFLEVGRQTLLARQIDLVRRAGAAEIFVSGRAGGDYSAFGCPVVVDPFPNGGPLAGMASAFQALGDPLLLVLAVDMPNLGVELLQRLYAGCQGGLGAVPVCGEMVEPLAAYYPKAAEALLQGCLAEAPRDAVPGPRQFAQACVQAGLAKFVPLASGESAQFKSWNCPGDVTV